MKGGGYRDRAPSEGTGANWDRVEDGSLLVMKLDSRQRAWLLTRLGSKANLMHADG